MLNALLDQFLLTWKLMWDRRVPIWVKAIGLLPFIYIISPIDLLPDVIFGLGQLDDIGVLLAGMRLFEMAAPGTVVAEHRAEIAARRAAVSGGPSESFDTVNAPHYRVRSERDRRA